MAVAAISSYVDQWLKVASGGNVVYIGASAVDPAAEVFECQKCKDRAYFTESDFVPNCGMPNGLLAFVSKHRHRVVSGTQIMQYVALATKLQPLVTSRRDDEGMVTLRCNSELHYTDDVAHVISAHQDRFLAPNGVDMQMPNEVTEWCLQHKHAGEVKTTGWSKSSIDKWVNSKPTWEPIKPFLGNGYENYSNITTYKPGNSYFYPLIVKSPFASKEPMVEISTTVEVETVRTIPTKTGRKFRK